MRTALKGRPPQKNARMMRRQDIAEARALLDPACPGITDRDTRLLLGLGLLACHGGRLDTFRPLGVSSSCGDDDKDDGDDDEAEPFSGVRVRLLPDQSAILVVDPSSRFVGRRFSI